MGISILARPFVNVRAVHVVMPAVGVLCWSSYASYEGANGGTQFSVNYYFFGQISVNYYFFDQFSVNY